MDRYSYDGPVKEFDTCVNNRWKGSTIASSEKKAISNLAFQYKRQHNKAPSTKITLPGKIVKVQ